MSKVSRTFTLSQGQKVALTISYVPNSLLVLTIFYAPEEGRCKATWKREFKLPWREAGPPHHLNDKVDSDQ